MKVSRVRPCLLSGRDLTWATEEAGVCAEFSQRRGALAGLEAVARMLATAEARYPAKDGADGAAKQGESSYSCKDVADPQAQEALRHEHGLGHHRGEDSPLDGSPKELRAALAVAAIAAIPPGAKEEVEKLLTTLRKLKEDHAAERLERQQRAEAERQARHEAWVKETRRKAEDRRQHQEAQRQAMLARLAATRGSSPKAAMGGRAAGGGGLGGRGSRQCAASPSCQQAPASKCSFHCCATCCRRLNAGKCPRHR